jgi:hypothetical protein
MDANNLPRGAWVGTVVDVVVVVNVGLMWRFPVQPPTTGGVCAEARTWVSSPPCVRDARSPLPRQDDLMSGLRVDAVRVADKVPFSMKLDIENLKVGWPPDRKGLWAASVAALGPPPPTPSHPLPTPPTCCSTVF